MSKSWFRNILVLFQFSVAIFLLASTLLVRSQMKLITEEDLGFDKERVVLVKNAHYLDQRMESMQQELLQRDDIKDVSTSFFVPGDNLINWGFGAKDWDNGFSLNVNLTNENYLSTMDMKLKEGRFFSKDFGTDTFGIVLNETAVELLEYDEPIGKTLFLWNDRNRPFTVIGVVEDYFYESKHQRIRPHGIMNLTSMDWAPEAYLAVRMKTENFKEVVEFIEDSWNEAVPEIPFEYAFLDTHYEGIYHNEKQTQTVLYLFAAIAIFISCLGLFGLASFMAERRTKEIGIRKTNGAETGNILVLLSIDLTKWVLIANIIAWPLTWLAMRRWLQGFAYQADIKIWIFIAAGVIAILIALFTVLFHALRASRQNPVRSLRYE
jgi:putative ABC transport system permease protein